MALSDATRNSRRCARAHRPRRTPGTPGEGCGSRPRGGERAGVGQGGSGVPSRRRRGPAAEREAAAARAGGRSRAISTRVADGRGRVDRARTRREGGSRGASRLARTSAGVGRAGSGWRNWPAEQPSSRRGTSPRRAIRPTAIASRSSSACAWTRSTRRVDCARRWSDRSRSVSSRQLRRVVNRWRTPRRARTRTRESVRMQRDSPRRDATRGRRGRGRRRGGAGWDTRGAPQSRPGYGGSSAGHRARQPSRIREPRRRQDYRRSSRMPSLAEGASAAIAGPETPRVERAQPPSRSSTEESVRARRRRDTVRL